MIRSVTVLSIAFRGGGERCERARISSVDALVARPRGGVGPVVVYANAATPLGIDEPAIARFLGGLAAAGFVAIAPELPDLRRGEVTPATLDALVSVVGASGSRVALFGASTGAGLVILAAADPRVADDITGVAAIAPFACLRTILKLATTGHYGDRPFAAAALVGTAATRSLVASAPDDPAVPALVANTDPGRFAELYEALLPKTRDLLEELSPVTRIPHVLAPIELASAPNDCFFPVDEARALARAGKNVRLTVTHALEHVRPRLRPGLPRVVSLVERTLARAAHVEPTPGLQPAHVL